MKKFLVFFITLTFMFGITEVALADLIDRGGGLIYDTDLNITWLADANYAETTGYDDALYGFDTGGKMNPLDAKIWAEDLVYYDPVRGVTWYDWRLPKTYDSCVPVSYSSTCSEMAHMYYVELGGTAGGNFSDITDPDLALFSNPPTDGGGAYYWSETLYPENPGLKWFFRFQFGYDATASSGKHRAWAVRDGDVGLPIPNYSCVGFESPMNSGPVTVKGKNRALPLKAQLYEDGSPIIDEDIVAPPVIQVWYDPSVGEDPVDVTADALYAGEGTDGNQFVYTIEGIWQFNLKTKNYTAPGAYTIYMETGDASEYEIDPTCQAIFVVN